jgi:hypothetical protein
MCSRIFSHLKNIIVLGIKHHGVAHVDKFAKWELLMSVLAELVTGNYSRTRVVDALHPG